MGVVLVEEPEACHDGGGGSLIRFAGGGGSVVVVECEWVECPVCVGQVGCGGLSGWVGGVCFGMGPLP